MNVAYTEQIEALIKEAIMNEAIRSVLADAMPLLSSGKMLRARLTMALGDASDVPESILLASSATVELIHLASLLHDDVIDNGTLRRGAPTVWVEKGTAGAILMGDYLVSCAFSLLLNKTNERLVKQLLACTRDIIEAEINQELNPPISAPDWDECMSIARKKTGALFAFAAYAAADEREGLSEALLEAGYEMGTAYQLVDDLLDASGDSELAGKTLGNDARQGKNTALSPGHDVPVAQVIDSLLQSSLERIVPWPDVYLCLEEYLQTCFQPVIDSFAVDLEAG